MDAHERGRDIVSKVAHVAVASVCPDGTPWNTPVFAACDERFAFYWRSYRESQHSQNIRRNPNVFLVTYDLAAPPGAGEGLYIVAEAEELSDPGEIEKALRLLAARGEPGVPHLDAVSGRAPLRAYAARPRRLWVNGGQKNGEAYVDVRNEIRI